MTSKAEGGVMLQFVNTFDVGGATEYAFMLSEHANPLAQPPLLAAGPGTAWLDRAERLGRVHTLETMKPTHRPSKGLGLIGDAKACLKLAAVLRAENVAVLHSHGSKARLMAGLAGFLARTPVRVQSAHGFSFHPEMGPLLRWLRVGAEWVAGRTNHHLVLECDSDLRRAQQLRLSRPKAMSRIYTGIDLAKNTASTSPESTRTSLGIPDDAFVVMTVGRLSTQKDPMTAARVARVLSEDENTYVVFVGDGEMREPVERLAGNSPRVLFLGNRPDVPDLLGAADLMLVTSRWEGIPLSVLIAQLNSKPVVSTPVGGLAEVVLDGETGSIVAEGDIDGFVRAIRLIRSSPAVADRMGVTARELVRSRHAIPVMGESFVELYRHLLNGGHNQLSDSDLERNKLKAGEFG